MKNVLKTVSFFLALALLTGLLSLLLRPKGNRAEDGMLEAGAMGILAEPEDTLDVVFLGDSIAYCCFDPVQLWKESGIASYVCAGVDQRLYQADEYLDIALSRQQPRLVILETNILYRDHGALEGLAYQAERYIPALRYHDRWKDLTLRDLNPTVQHTSIVKEKGVYPKYEIDPADTSNYAIPTEVQTPAPSQNQRLLAKMAKKCAASGAELILVSAPTTRNWDYTRHNALSRLAQNLGLRYYDLNLMPEEVPIDWALDTLDRGDHLNVTGAQKVTAWVQEFFIDMKLFTDHRGRDAYAHWDALIA